MAPNKWDEESDEGSTPPSSPPPARRGRFDDEEEDSDVLESWDAEEDSEVEREKGRKAAEAQAKAEAEAKAKHKTKTERIAEHQAANARRKKELEEEDSSEEEDEREKRARLRKVEKDADLKHAEDLFGDLGISNDRVSKRITLADPNDPANMIDLSSLSIFDPKTKDQFSKLRDTLAPLLTQNAKKPQYVVFLQEFTKAICRDLKSDEIKKISSGLTTLSNEKMKEEKAAEKGGKKTKAQKTKTTLNAARDTAYKADTAAYDDLDDDDFM